MDEKAIRGAADKLELIDIVLVGQSLTTDIDRYVLCKMIDDGSAQLQTSLNSGYTTIEYQGEAKTVETFLVTIRLGARLVETMEKGTDQPLDEPNVLATIEAIYYVEYRVNKGNLTKRQMEQFSSFNAVHNVWPFWRQVVHDTARAARLPDIVIPLFRGPPRPQGARKVMKAKAKKVAGNATRTKSERSSSGRAKKRKPRPKAAN